MLCLKYKILTKTQYFTKYIKPTTIIKLRFGIKLRKRRKAYIEYQNENIVQFIKIYATINTKFKAHGKGLKLFLFVSTILQSIDIV